MVYTSLALLQIAGIKYAVIEMNIKTIQTI